MVIRLLLTLSCALIFCSSYFIFAQSRDNVQVSQSYIQQQEKRKQDLLRWKDQHIRLQQQLQEWNEFWEIIEASNLKPDLWKDYPVRIRGTYNPAETSRIVSTLSNDISTGRGFWFAPQYMYVGPMLEEYSAGDETRERQALQIQLRGRIINHE